MGVESELKTVSVLDTSERQIQWRGEERERMRKENRRKERTYRC